MTREELDERMAKKNSQLADLLARTDTDGRIPTDTTDSTGMES